MKKTAYILITILLLLVQQSNAQEKFVLEGTLTGFEGGIKFIICPMLPNRDADRDHDSVMYLTNGRFRIEGDIKESTQFLLLALPKIPPDNPKDFEGVSFWVENKHMSLKGEKGNLLFSDISGSAIQDQYEEYVNVGKAMQKINKQIKDSVLSYHLSEEARIPLRKISYENDLAIEKGRMEFIYGHPDYYSCVAELVFYINFMPEMISMNRAVGFYKSLSDDFKNNVYGKQINSFIAGEKSESHSSSVTEFITNKQLIGNKPLSFALPDSSGNILELASLKGKIILLDFWASGCGPCRLEHKNYLEFYQKFHAKGFEIFSVSQDQSKKYWLRAMREDNMIWKSVWDSDRTVTKKYRIRSIPANYLINSDGIIIGQDLRGEKLLKTLEELFMGK
jgi:peroxiredoxin